MTDIQLAQAVSDIVDAIIPAAPAPEPDAPAAPAAPVFWADRTNVRFNPRRGFEAALAGVLFDGTPRTSAEIVTALLSSGEYHRVAPQAANLRPHRPVNFLLKEWVASGLVRRSA